MEEATDYLKTDETHWFLIRPQNGPYYIRLEDEEDFDTKDVTYIYGGKI